MAATDGGAATAELGASEGAGEGSAAAVLGPLLDRPGIGDTPPVGLRLSGAGGNPGDAIVGAVLLAIGAPVSGPKVKDWMSCGSTGSVMLRLFFKWMVISPSASAGKRPRPMPAPRR